MPAGRTPRVISGFPGPGVPPAVGWLPSRDGPASRSQRVTIGVVARVTRMVRANRETDRPALVIRWGRLGQAGRESGMVSSVALRAGELAAAVLVAGVVLLVVMAAGVWWLRRRVRRLLEVLGLILASRARGAAASAGGAGSRWLWSLPLPDRRWRGGRARRELWRAVGAAEHAGAAARRGGAPTGDLDGLCRRLRQAAGSADRRLAIGQRPAVAGAGLDPGVSEVSGLVSAAGQIQAAASAALALVSGPAARQLADDVRIEVAALAAGLASAAGTKGPPGSVETR